MKFPPLHPHFGTQKYLFQAKHPYEWIIGATYVLLLYIIIMNPCVRVYPSNN